MIVGVVSKPFEVFLIVPELSNVRHEITNLVLKRADVVCMFFCVVVSSAYINSETIVLPLTKLPLHDCGKSFELARYAVAIL